MINFKISQNGEVFSLPENWSEITIPQAIDILKAYNGLSKEIRDVYELATMPEGEERKKLYDKRTDLITEEHLIKEIPTFHGRCLEILGKLDPKKVDSIPRGDRFMLFQEYMLDKVIGLNYSPAYEPQGIESFKVNGEEYFLPTEADGLGVKVPMADGTADEFCYATDLEMAAKQMEGGRWELAPLIVACLCRKKVDGKREPYTTEGANQRAKVFKELSMDIVFEVFFCSMKLSDIYQSYFLMYSGAVQAPEA
jgi:hypothetical protein